MPTLKDQLEEFVRRGQRAQAAVDKLTTDEADEWIDGRWYCPACGRSRCSCVADGLDSKDACARCGCTGQCDYIGGC